MDEIDEARVDHHVTPDGLVAHGGQAVVLTACAPAQQRAALLAAVAQRTGLAVSR